MMELQNRDSKIDDCFPFTFIFKMQDNLPKRPEYIEALVIGQTTIGPGS